MLIVPRKRIWTQQPQGVAQIDWSNPLTQGIAAAFVFSNGLVDCVSGRTAENKGVIFNAGPLGVCITAVSAGIRIPWDLGFYGEDITVTVVETRDYLPPGAFFVADNRESGAGYIYGNSTTLHNPLGVLTAPGRKVSSFCRNEFYQNKIKTSKAIGTGLVPKAGIRLFGRYTEVDAFSGSKIAAVYLHRRNISACEHENLADNPWQIFRAPYSRIFVPTGAGVGSGDSLTASSIIASPATVGSPLLSQKHALTASSVTTAPAAVASPTITQRHVLSATAVSASPAVVGSPSVTQKHVLSATAISAAPAVVGSPTLTEIVAGTLSALPVIAAPAVVGTPAITQRHALSAGAISAGPATFGTPTLAQQHALIAQGVTAGAAVVGAPVLSEGGAVIFTSAPNGGGYSRAGENHTRPPQTNTVRH